jgi:transposase
MFYIGIDVAKRKHCMATITSDGERVIEAFEFPSTQEGFGLMLKELCARGITHENSRAALEATGHYSKALTEHLVAHGFEVAIGNPLQTHNFAKAQSIRKVKNDAVDSLALAQWLLLAKPNCAVLSSSKAAELKSIARSRTFQSQIIGDSKRKMLAILDQLFPEYAQHFSDVFGSTSLAVLKRYPSAQALSRAHIDSLTSLLNKTSRGKLGSELAWSLRSIAKKSFATNRAIEAQSFQLKQLIALIEFAKCQLREIDKEMEKLLQKAGTTITTIPGIGPVLGATILGEIGDISRFKSPSSLVAFAGLDPSVFESGEFKGTKGHLSKRGSTYLRWALWLAADRARRFDPVFGEYYAKKRSEGKCHKVAISALARKLCNTIFAVLNKNVQYICPVAR